MRHTSQHTKPTTRHNRIRGYYMCGLSTNGLRPINTKTTEKIELSENIENTEYTEDSETHQRQAYK